MTTDSLDVRGSGRFGADRLALSASEWPRALAAIVAVGVALRVAAAVAMGSDVTALPGTADQVSYHVLATRVVEGHGLTFPRTWWPMTRPDEPTGHWSYLYTGFLAVVYALVGVIPVVPRLLQAVLVGVAQPLVTYWIARRCFGATAGLFAAALVAFYAYFIYYSATLMTEPFYITSILIGLALVLRLAGGERPARLAVAAGLAFAAAVILRQVFLLILPVIAGWALWAAPAGRRRVVSNQLAICLVTVAVVIAPFTAYNFARFDRFVLLNTNAGFAFFWANHPIHGDNFYDILPSSLGSYQDLVPEEVRHLSEAELDRELMRRGLGFVAADPGRFVRLSMSRIPDYFKFWPEATSSTVSNLSRVFSFGLALPFMVLGIALAAKRHLQAGDADVTPTRGLRRLARSPEGLLLAFALAYTVIHLASWALIRYRLPVDAALIPFAGLAAARLWHRLTDRATRRPAGV